MSEFSYSVRIDSPKRTIVDIADFQFSNNKITFLFGESGIGKSMLLKAIYGLLDPEELKITINNLPYEEYLASSRVKELQSNGLTFVQPL